MRKYCFSFLFSVVALWGQAQDIIVRDSEIKSIVDEISVENLQALNNKLVSFGTRHTLSDTTSAIKGIGAARRWIFSEFQRYSKESGGRLKVEYDTFFVEPDGNRITKKAELKNVLAILPGTDPADKRVFIVSGHFDSRASNVNNDTITAPGANDDGSGTVAVMELARVMSKHKFNATIIFACVTGEEQGLLGSANLAKRAIEEKWEIKGMITNDIVGNSYGAETDLKDNLRLRVFSEGVPAAETGPMALQRQQAGGENDSPARQFSRYVKEVGERYVDNMEVKLIFRKDRYLRGGDHTPFSNAGFAAIRFTEMNENFDRQHQDLRTENGRNYGDLSEFVDFGYLKKVTGINAATLANLAKAPQEPQNVSILTKQLTNFTELAWGIPQGQKPKGYYVLLRETTSPFWEKKLFVETNQVKLPYSKDNYFFGVQSVDDKGHESLIVFPKPLRQ
ncbi:M20/M25/M40 family metallo-hydrolase [Solitalea canadensis]|uniref:Putative aminopeptidase n=1 Tax=Solitalea canadensis (strain ATCC 29591 / DSM 3403 / JCM 21819 / LMG 8368 / NBRC 15130 / NCIMB 12057 / USAM 9D) TaxID=929556 RepID=H8KMG3_SOLCM|nr:M20/M25/M40 family metallo-hydrolase [Solitalea canadensis]AFD08758.1 putative aminopeptidase [Solitalea canadensis DSM 3403]